MCWRAQARRGVSGVRSWEWRKPTTNTVAPASPVPGISGGSSDRPWRGAVDTAKAAISSDQRRENERLPRDRQGYCPCSHSLPPHHGRHRGECQSLRAHLGRRDSPMACGDGKTAARIAVLDPDLTSPSRPGHAGLGSTIARLESAVSRERTRRYRWNTAASPC
jgi:hypothetical protein